MLFDKNVKEKKIDEQTQKALEEKHAIAEQKFYTCPRCGNKKPSIDAIGDPEDYLCKCPNCGDTWIYPKEKFNRETRKQNKVLVKAKRYWKWHNGGKHGRFMIIMRIILEIVLTTLLGLCFVLSFMIAGGVL